jgi:transposase
MRENLPHAQITFDHYHVIALVNKALDEVRKSEAKEQTLLKHSRYWWLKNPKNLTKKQAKKIDNLSQLNLKTARAYRIKLALQEVYKLKDPKAAEQALKKWYYWATHPRIPQIIKVAKTIKAHWEGILNYFEQEITNGLVECFNGIIQTLKRRARGYRNITNFITMVYLVKGELDFGLPAVTRLNPY